MTTSAPRPRCLRPAAVAVAIALHAAALAGHRPQEGLRLAGPVEIDLVSDPAPEAAPTPESLPAPEARAGPIPIEPEAQTSPEIASEPVPPEPPPIAGLPPVAEPLPSDPRRPVEVVRPPEKRKLPERRKPRRQDRSGPPPSEVDSTRSEVARATDAAARAAVASYAAEVSAELRRHRHYPAAAREAGITGVVVVAFVIGPGGRVATHSIVRSSGHPILDRVVRGMMGAIALPPPPGGIFRSTVPVRFDLTR